MRTLGAWPSQVPSQLNPASHYRLPQRKRNTKKTCGSECAYMEPGSLAVGSGLTWSFLSMEMQHKENMQQEYYMLRAKLSQLWLHGTIPIDQKKCTSRSKKCTSRNVQVYRRYVQICTKEIYKEMSILIERKKSTYLVARIPQVWRYSPPRRPTLE